MPRRGAVAFFSPFPLFAIAYGLTRGHITIMSPSYESLRTELDEIVERYRAHVARDGSKVALTREEAVKRIRQLGFTEGDAVRWLGSKPRSKSPRLNRH